MTMLDNTVKELKKETASARLADDSAIQKLSVKVPTVDPDQTVEDARRNLFENIKNYDTVNYIYAVNKNGKLKGVISLKNLFETGPDIKIIDVMKTEVVTVHPKTKQERIAIKALKANIKAVPVTDEHENFLGVIQSDDILNILYKEAQKDFLHLSGIITSKQHFIGSGDITITRSFFGRIPWILVGLMGGILSAGIIGNFESVLEKNIILAFFVPLVVYISDAVGTQTQTLLIRDLAVEENIPIIRYTLRQIVISTFIGLFCALLIWIVVTLFWSNPFLGAIIGTAAFVAVSSSASVAILIPYLLSKTKQDPAIGSGPFTTILQDILSIVIYFIITSSFT